MYTMTLTDAVQRMPTNGRGGSAIARVITTPAITAVNSTSVTVTSLGANVAAGDVLFLGTQGFWGVCRSVASNTATVKAWYRLGGGVGFPPAVSGSLAAFPSGVLASAHASFITGAIADTATDNVTLVDPAGTTVAIGLPFAGAPVKMWGPWRATAGAATVTLTFEAVGDLDT